MLFYELTMIGAFEAVEKGKFEYYEECSVDHLLGKTIKTPTFQLLHDEPEHNYHILEAVGKNRWVAWFIPMSMIKEIKILED